MLYAAAAIIILAAIIYLCHRQNNNISALTVQIETDKLDKSVTLVHLSDLHSKIFGEKSCRLADKISQAHPDLICFTGDFLDRYTKDIYPALDSMEVFAKIAPMYYCPGNHDYHRENREQIYDALRERGVILLRSQYARFSTGAAPLHILGLDPIGYDIHSPIALREFSEIDGFKLLITHFPEQIVEFSQYDIDLTLAGHAHGGQFRLPFFGGVYAPGQGFHPKWTKGLYAVNGRKLIVSPGLGNSGFPLRLGNPPTVIIVKLIPKQSI